MRNPERFGRTLGFLIGVLEFSPFSILDYPNDYLDCVYALRDNTLFRPIVIEKVSKWKNEMYEGYGKLPDDLKLKYQYFVNNVYN